MCAYIPMRRRPGSAPTWDRKALIGRGGEITRRRLSARSDQQVTASGHVQHRRGIAYRPGHNTLHRRTVHRLAECRARGHKTPPRFEPDEAGIRIDPPPSLAPATGTIPAATAAAEPPDGPAGVLLHCQGYRVAPYNSGSVIPFAPNSGVLVFPKITKPASSQR